MRILIDLQACQSSGSRTRGIGRYSLSLAKAMVRNRQSHDIHFFLNASFGEAVLELRAIFSGLLPKENIHVWHGLHASGEYATNSEWCKRANELIREQAILELRPDLLHIASLFEGDDAVANIGGLSQSILTAVTLFDLIPLIHADPYLENKYIREWYFRKLQSLKRADLLLAISESSRQEGIRYLDYPSEKIINISSAVDERFQPQEIDTLELNNVKLQYGLIRPFVMYTGGIDLRKNIEGLIQAFAHLDKEFRRQYQLAIVCSVKPPEKERLLKLGRQFGLEDNEVIMTGFVPDDDLPKLYQACSLFVFPSWHEGFGLPALEAMTLGVPTIASNTSSLPEVLGNEDALFDPHNVKAIAQKMQDVLSDKDLALSLVKNGLEQAKKFSWDESAKSALCAFEELFHAKQNSLHNISQGNIKPRLAYFSPVPSAASGIADYSAELLPELAVHYEIEVIVDQETVNDSWISANFPVRNWRWFVEHAKRYDRILYHMGNSTFHIYMLNLMESYPGVVVLHDFYHSGLLAHMDIFGIQRGILDNALFLSHGYKAVYERKLADDLSSIVWKYPCNQLALSYAQGVIVHSEFSKKLANEWYMGNDADQWKLIPHLRVIPYENSRSEARKALGMKEDDFIVCSFGIVGSTKLNHEILDAWLSSVLLTKENCHLIFVGANDENEYGLKLLEKIDQSTASHRIKITGFVSMDLFRTYLQAADMAIQLRGLSRGETSGTVLDCMAYGLPTIINNNGSMTELPENALIKLNSSFELGELTEKINLLFENVQIRESLGFSAQEYIKLNHCPRKIGVKYQKAIESFYLNLPASLMHQTIQKIADLDTPYCDEDLQSAAFSLNINRMGQKSVLFDCTAIETRYSSECSRNIIRKLFELYPYRTKWVPVYAKNADLYTAVSDFEKYLKLPFDEELVLQDQLFDKRQGDVFICFDDDSMNKYLYDQLSILGIEIFTIDLEAFKQLDDISLAEMVHQFWTKLSLSTHFI